MEIIKTKDGSFTLFNNEYKDVYHSKFGALKEALYQFIYPIKNFLKKENNFNFFEIGFGLGYNYLATKVFLEKNKKSFKYIAVEKDKELFNFLLRHCKNFKIKNYCNLLKEAKGKIIFEDATRIKIKSQIIYHDAFSPSKNRELWTFDFLSGLKADFIITYTSNPKVRVSFLLNDYLVLPTFRFKGKGTLALNLKKLEYLNLLNYFKFDVKELALLFSNYAKPYGLEVKRNYPFLFKGGKIKVKDLDFYKEIKEIAKLKKEEQVIKVMEKVKEFWF